MKNHNRPEQQVAASQFPVNCQVLLACLTGNGGRVPLPDFYRIWEQMLPESGLPFPVPGADLRPPQATPAQTTSHKIEKTNIREGPD